MRRNNFFLRQHYERKYRKSDFDPQKALDNSLPIGKGLSRTRYQVLLNFLKKIDTADYSLLDIGSGPGSAIFALRGKFSELHGVDFSQTVLSQAQKVKSILPVKEQNRISFSYADVSQELPFKSCSFDVVLLLAVLEHVFDPYRVLREAKRVLKPEGILFLSVPNIAFLKQRINLLFGKLPVSQPIPFDAKNWEIHLWDSGHIHYFTLFTLKKLLIEVGFRIKEVKGDGSLAGVGNLWPSLLYTNFVVKCCFV